MDSSHHRQQSFRMAGCITVLAKLNFFRVGSLDREKADPVFPKWQETDAFIEHVEIQFLSKAYVASISVVFNAIWSMAPGCPTAQPFL